jgi:hypothetical protein
MKKSKVGLCILLVMSIIYGSVMFLSSFSMAVSLPTLNKIYTANRSLMPDEMFTAWERMASIPQPFYAGMAVLGLLSVVGCVLMWNLRRSGYHCYAIAQLMMLVLPLLFLGKGFLGIGDVMFTALFLFIYYLQLKRLDVFTPQEAIVPEDESSPKSEE